MSRQRNFWEGTFLGVLIGIVAGVLLAPKSGKETRADISAKTKKLAGDASKRAGRLAKDLGDGAERLRQVAKDLGAEAREESQALIARAEVMKQDLNASTKDLAQASKSTKDATLANVRGLMDEGAALMIELEGVTKRLVNSAKVKARKGADEEAGEAAKRVEELERNGHQDISEP